MSMVVVFVVVVALIWRLQWPHRRGRARNTGAYVEHRHLLEHLAQSLIASVEAVVIVAVRGLVKLVLAGASSMFALVMRSSVLVVGSDMFVLAPVLEQGLVWGPKLASLAKKMTIETGAAKAIVMATVEYSIANVVMALVVVVAVIETKNTGGTAELIVD